MVAKPCQIMNIKICLFLLLMGLAGSAQAEYYLVSQGSGYDAANGCGAVRCNPTCCGSYYKTTYYVAPIHYIHSKAPKRHAYQPGSAEMAPYAWVSY